MKDIYPIYLPGYVAEALVLKHAREEFEEHKRFGMSSRNKYEYSARVLENGDVALGVRYSFDDGYCMGAGSALTKTVRPYGEAELTAIKRNKMMLMAAVAYEESEEQKRTRAIQARARKMFPEEFE